MTSRPAPDPVFAFELNGETVTVSAPAHHTLLELLRYRQGLTGTKQGCDKGDCGACTVLLDGSSVLSCLTLAVTVAGRAVTTIEGLGAEHRRAEGRPHPVQEAFDRSGALQCGFCQPGMLLSSAALLRKNPSPTADEVRAALSGNLCRCTGYAQIVEAVLRAAAVERGEDPPAPAWSIEPRGEEP